MSLEQSWTQAVRASAKRLWSIDLDGALLEPPTDPKFGDYTCNAPMRLAKQLRKPPRAIADELAADLRNAGLPHLAKVEVAGAGFVNLTAGPDFYQQEVTRILAEGAEYGRSSLGAGRKVLVEHCSANPTGPLHIAHGRQAAVGDSLASILDFAGYRVHRDFYINDTGNQIEMLGRSILWRMYEAEGRKFTEEQRGVEIDEESKKEIPLIWAWTDVDGRRFEILLKNAYKGDYIKDLVAELQAQGGPVDLDRAKRFGKDRMLQGIRRDLDRFRVHYDTWQSEEELHRSGKVDDVLNKYQVQGLTFTKDGATWANFQDYGDTQPRPLVKKDGSYVYRLPDIAYHFDKIARGNQILIDLWGPDHHAHIANVTAGLRMLNLNLVPPEEVPPAGGGTPDTAPVAFKVLLIQHCKLIQNGVEVKMSKRAASYVTLDELMDEVGVDATRFFFVMRKTNSHLDFDLDVAKSKSLENPVYYAQYAHARICSIFEKGLTEQKIAASDLHGGLWRGSFDAAAVGSDEIELIKVARSFQRRIEISARDLDPAALTDYLRELSAAFQRYYEYGNRDVERRVLHEDEAKRRGKLASCAAVQQVLRNGFRLLGVSAPEKM
jgi:arginyl-tRNA synthetase